MREKLKVRIDGKIFELQIRIDSENKAAANIKIFRLILPYLLLFAGTMFVTKGFFRV